MANNDSNDKKDTGKLKGTLSIGKSLDDFKKNLAEKETAKSSKRKIEVEVVSKKKTLKPAKPKVENTDRPSEKSKKLPEEVEASADSANQLTKSEEANRLRVLKEFKAQEPKEEPVDNNTFFGPSIVAKKSFETTIVTSPKESFKEKKDIPVKPSGIHKAQAVEEDEELEEEKANKKRSALKKKEKDDQARNWRDMYYENEEESEDFSEADDEKLPEENSYKPDTVVISRALADLKRKGKTKRDKSNKRTSPAIKREVIIEGEESVRSLAHKMSEKSKEVIKALAGLGLKAEEDTIIDVETAELLVNEMGHKFKKALVEDAISSLYEVKDSETSLQPRPPIVTIMGHVDHGKTSLLDYIRKTNVVAKESGGITQHIGAYQISTKDNKKITFLDTPGHEAFTQMRARGATVTDIVVLVVAADDGIKPQSIEAINHARAANVPIIVAINKIDKPLADVMKVKTELLQQNLVVEDMGGDILAVEVSALTGAGVEDLLDNILLQAEILGLSANPKRKAQGLVIEARVEKGKGVVASIIVKTGTLKKGDIFVSGMVSGKVRLITNDLGKELKEALPSTPVEIIGFNGEVSAGDDFIVVDSESDAKKIIDFRASTEGKPVNNPNEEQDDLSLLLKNLGENKKRLHILLKADVHGSKEAILASLNKITHDEVEIKIVHSGIGQITESDVLLAKTTGAIIYGFNVRANNQSKDLALREKIDIRYFSIIYDLLDNAKATLGGLLNPEMVEKIIGYAEVREVFEVSKVGKIAGSYVTEGVIKKSAFARVLRSGTVIHEGVLAQLKRFKEDVKEVKNGYECGIMFHNYQDIVVGDVIECFEKNERERTL